MGKFSMVKEIEPVRIISPENASTTDVDKHLKKRIMDAASLGNNSY